MMRSLGLLMLCLLWAPWLTRASLDPLDAPSAPPLLTLPECYQLALQQSETIAIQRERLAETEGRFLQALSGVLPRVTFAWSEKRQDGSGGSAFQLRDVPERKFVVTQPLFAGFKEFAAMAGSRAERRQRVHEQANAELLLLVDVAEAFYLLRQQREELGALEITRATLRDRLEELTERERLGRSRTSEVVSAEAQLHQIESEVAQVLGQETTARQLLEFLTGLPRIDGIHDPDPLPSALEPETAYVAHAHRRPDVHAAEEALQIARQHTRIARSRFYPTVSAESAYYTKRVGASAGVDWDALLKVDVPLFQGGQALGATREASSQARVAQLQLAQVQRQAQWNIRDLYRRLEAALTRVQRLTQALAASEETYRLDVEDYRLRLVNHLDVLHALQTLQEARRHLVQATMEAKRLSWQLRAAVGERPSTASPTTRTP
jgi:outer membrane protein